MNHAGAAGHSSTASRAGIWGFAVVVCLLMSTTAVSARPRLLLAGGHLPVCSSAATDACEKGRIPIARVQSARFRLDADGIERINAGGWLPHRKLSKERVVAALTRWHERVGSIELPGDDLAPALQTGGSSRDARAWTDLADFERDRVWDALEQEPVQERVELAASTADSGASVFREFVAMARELTRRERPRILIVTASGRDPFASIDFYRVVFEQAGAQVRWLPLDHALRAAQANRGRDCRRLDRLRGERLAAHDRARLYPKRAKELSAACHDPTRLDALINWADGVFLNGGDQSFTRAAWFARDGSASQQLTLLLARLDAGELVLGGTSAGTAVQAGRTAMIVSGSSTPSAPATAIAALPPHPSCAFAQACAGVNPDALLYHPAGGLGSFPGVLDTHFSNRGREFRLARLLLDSGTELGVGIDETTALRIDVEDGRMRGGVVGQGGVSVFQRVGGDLLWRRRYLAGESVELELQPPSPSACGDSKLAAATVVSGDDSLADWLDALPADAKWHPLVLTAGGRREAAGSVCAPAAGRARWWRLNP